MKNKSPFAILAIGLFLICFAASIFLTTIPVPIIVLAIGSVTFAVLSLRE